MLASRGTRISSRAERARFAFVAVVIAPSEDAPSSARFAITLRQRATGVYRQRSADREHGDRLIAAAKTGIGTTRTCDARHSCAPRHASTAVNDRQAQKARCHRRDFSSARYAARLPRAAVATRVSHTVSFGGRFRSKCERHRFAASHAPQRLTSVPDGEQRASTDRLQATRSPRGRFHRIDEDDLRGDPRREAGGLPSRRAARAPLSIMDSRYRLRRLLFEDTTRCHALRDDGDYQAEVPRT